MVFIDKTGTSDPLKQGTTLKTLAPYGLNISDSVCPHHISYKCSYLILHFGLKSHLGQDCIRVLNYDTVSLLSICCLVSTNCCFHVLRQLLFIYFSYQLYCLMLFSVDCDYYYVSLILYFLSLLLLVSLFIFFLTIVFLIFVL